MTDKYCPLRFREFGSSPHDQRCIGDYCAWFEKCSQSHAEPIYGMKYGNIEWRQVIGAETSQEPREADENANDEDTREKLDAEVRKWCGKYAYQADMVWVWLNRQAAITERDTRLRELYKFEENHRLNIDSIEEVNRKLNKRIAELQEQVNGLTAELEARDKYPDGFIPHVEMMEQVGELTTERDYWKRQYELISRAVEDVVRNYCDEGLA